MLHMRHCCCSVVQSPTQQDVGEDYIDHIQVVAQNNNTIVLVREWRESTSLLASRTYASRFCQSSDTASLAMILAPWLLLLAR